MRGEIKMKIDIDIEDSRKYAEVAFLVDRDDFLADINVIRKRINLSRLPYVFPTFPYDEANAIVDFYTKRKFTINDVRISLEEFCAKQGLLNLYALDKTLGGAVLFAESFARKYGKNYLYIPVILAAILVGHIQEVDFLSTQMYVINHKVVQEELLLLEKDEEIMTIRVNRESKPEEIKHTFDFIQKYYFKTKKTEDDDGLNNVYENVPNGKLADTAGNIKRDREWYWLKKTKWSYQQIKKHYKETQRQTISLQGVKLAISRYSDNLK